MGVTGGLGPVVVIGFNEDVAWTHTVSTGKRFTLYELNWTRRTRRSTSSTDSRRHMVTQHRHVAGRVRRGARRCSNVLFAPIWGPVSRCRAPGLGWTAATRLRDPGREHPERPVRRKLDADGAGPERRRAAHRA